MNTTFKIALSFLLLMGAAVAGLYLSGYLVLLMFKQSPSLLTWDLYGDYSRLQNPSNLTFANQNHWRNA